MDINNNPILTEAKIQNEEYYLPLVMGFVGHAVGVYFGAKHKFTLLELMGTAAGCGLIGVLAGKGVSKLIFKK